MADTKDNAKCKADKKQFPSWRILSAAKFTETYAEGCRNSQRFCFILGSGASVESGIPTGGSLEYGWMKCLMGEGTDKGTPPMRADETREFAGKLKADHMLQHDFSDIEEEWRKAKKENRYTMSSEFYFDIYKLRFYPNNRNGYRYLEHLMEHAEPSFGYHPLAELLTDKYNNNLVITTNFDSLVEDALFLYTDQKPLTINHELTADYIGDHSIKRPIIAKLHRGLFFDPLNDPEGTTELKGNWKRVLREIFHIYTPVVIGYGGGDQSLMKLLNDEDLDLPKGIYWCYMDKYGLPGEKIQELIQKKNGFFVQTEGFDHIMLVLGNQMCPEQITTVKTMEYLKNQMNRRIMRYGEQVRKLEERGKEDLAGNLGEGITKFNKNEAEERAERKENDKMTEFDYWSEGNSFQLESNYDKAIESYSKAIELNSRYASAYLNRGYAYEALEENDKALLDYNQACRIDSVDPFVFLCRGDLYKRLKNYDKAFEDYNRALLVDPHSGIAYNKRGDLYAELGEDDKALEDYSKGIDLNPQNAFAYHRRSIIYRKLNMIREAEEDEKKWREYLES